MEERKKNKLTKEVYLQNELNANIGLTKGCIVTGFVLMLAWVLYLTGVFKVTDTTLKIINIFFPILISVLLSTAIYWKTNLIKKPSFKYFLIIQFIFVTFALNVIIPKHAILMWAVVIILVSHYFNPKIAIFTYVFATLMMFFGIYLGMLFGEWDSNLLNGANYIVINGESINVDDANHIQRMQWLDYLMSQGDNRYLKTFLYYFIPRWLIITLISSISYSVSKRTMSLLQYESNFVRTQEKLKSELGVASSIQTSVLPKVDKKDNNIYGLMHAAKEVGGDFYDYFYIDDSHIALVIGDVSGKGIPAALFMMKTETLIKSLATSFKGNTKKIMKSCNVSLCNNNDANMFVTCWLGILNLSTGELKYTNAGHNSPLLIQGDKVEFLKDKPDVILGAFEQSEYVEHTIKLNQGDKILLYTDGVTEAHNIDDDLYGEDALLSFTEKYRGLTPKDFVGRLRSSINTFSRDAVQFDDITILMYHYNVNLYITESKVFKADVKELDNLFEYSTTVLQILEFSQKDITMINTALEEIFVNVAHYAYEDKGTIEITLSRYQNKVSFIFKDSGKPFNPLDKKDPNITASSEEREIGGLGIFMVKKIMDEVTYEYTDGQNILTLVKYKR